MAVKPLKELKSGEKGKITKVSGEGLIRRRILDMGVIPGSEIEMQRAAPLGDPIEVKIKGYHLSLRKNEAANIYVEIAG
ncbi:MAG: FeoA family protein [Candidatus Omnitrophota bacterium]|nr:FeoA family protein [Candidatus Omnitrophota bacterium]